MEIEKLSDSEYKELLKLVNQEEKVRNKHFQYPFELSQLCDIPLNELINHLNVNAPIQT
jgi:hypothetical protein